MNGQFNIGEITPKRYFIIAAITIGLLFGLAESNTNSFSGFFMALLQWQLQVCIPMLFLIEIHITLSKTPLFSQLNPWLKLFLSGLFAATAFAPFALAIDILFHQENFTSKNLGKEIFTEFVHMAPPVIITWITINAPWLVGFRLVKEDKNTSSESLTHSMTPGDSCVEKKLLSPRFYDLLPEEVRTEIIYLKAELHYLKVVTTSGNALVLYNLKDAINDIENLDGVHTHRSYWVAKKHIEKLKKSGRQGVLILSNGTEIPVSRAKFEKVKTSISNNKVVV